MTQREKQMWIKFDEEKPSPFEQRYLVAIKSVYGGKIIWTQRIFSWVSFVGVGGRPKYKFNTGNTSYKDIIFWRELPENPK